jgi:hypothetical protein
MMIDVLMRNADDTGGQQKRPSAIPLISSSGARTHSHAAKVCKTNQTHVHVTHTYTQPDGDLFRSKTKINTK